MNVNDIMTRPAISVGQDEPVAAAARLLRRHNIGSLPVTDISGRLRGIVTDRDIALRCAITDSNYGQIRVGEIMSRAVITASPADSVEAAVRTMSLGQVRRLPIVSEGKIVGMLSLCDMARSLECGAQAGQALTEISSNVKKL